MIHVVNAVFWDMAPGKADHMTTMCSCGVIRESELMSEHLDAMKLRELMDAVLSGRELTILGRKVSFA
jgi:hypothetical protein